jgi:hypothetical protein
LKDIFTDMQAKIGCPYLSDLPYYKRAVWFEIKRRCLSDYPKKQFSVTYEIDQQIKEGDRARIENEIAKLDSMAVNF